jgi:hypothetical protein
LTGSAESILKKKNQNDIVLVKKNKSQRVCHRVLTGSCRVSRVDPAGQPGHTGFFFPSFFRQPGPVPAPGRPGPGSTRRAGPGFKTMVCTLLVPLPPSLGSVYTWWLSIAGSACGRKDHLMVCFLTDPASKAARDIIIYFCIVWVAYIWKWAIYHFQWAWVKPTGRTRSWLVRSRWR